MTDFLLRFGKPTDAPVLLDYERAYFPAVPGQHHAGYLYADAELARIMLTEELAAPLRAFTIVAEKDDKIVGFAAAAPWSLPGTGQIDPAHILLQYLVVGPAHRRSGIAKARVAEIERRALGARQNVIVAHVPPTESDFYRAIDWEVVVDGRGYAWLPFGSHLRADIGDSSVGFPLMAAKVLRPRAIRRTFDFAIVSGRPTHDAATELMHIVDSGDVDLRDLDEGTRSMVDLARKGPVPQKVLDFFGSTRGRR
ncbi:GNAT family N-acetyltransferase [Cryobacterium sp. TMT1-66-1]|uniref:GNAT family N-acetyltransferase n=1 Tax=Cryobacterium sp. TMT1-66-1 TaxID=1259242 RepID=UPI00106A7F39|nr:GNAT family N-acetyltransferase [Cryobacterium sp. TMT1-66-1]TFD07812.1 N-acetyltransferase [Cryobacterium sp. TMT1-66-1]